MISSHPDSGHDLPGKIHGFQAEGNLLINYAMRIVNEHDGAVTVLLSILSGISFAGAGLGYKMADHEQCRPSVFILVFAMTGGAFAGMGIKALFEATCFIGPVLTFSGLWGQNN